MLSLPEATDGCAFESRGTLVQVAMMAAMMLPGAAPAAVRSGRAAPVFLASYLGVWVLVALALDAVYGMHGTLVAGALAIAAGLYELTPLKRHFRRRCHEHTGSGLVFGLDCVGSSIGLMLMVVALGGMSVAWMAAVAVLVLAQKVLPANAAIDVPVALAIVGVGIAAAL
jgi:predicted metal-binding membrane protein